MWYGLQECRVKSTEQYKGAYKEVDQERQDRQHKEYSYAEVQFILKVDDLQSGYRP